MTRLGRYLYYALVPSQRSKGSFALSYFCFVCVCGSGVGGGWVDIVFKTLCTLLSFFWWRTCPDC